MLEGPNFEEILSALAPRLKGVSIEDVNFEDILISLVQIADRNGYTIDNPESGKAKPQEWKRADGVPQEVIRILNSALIPLPEQVYDGEGEEVLRGTKQSDPINEEARFKDSGKTAVTGRYPAPLPVDLDLLPRESSKLGENFPQPEVKGAPVTENEGLPALTPRLERDASVIQTDTAESRTPVVERKITRLKENTGTTIRVEPEPEENPQRRILPPDERATVNNPQPALRNEEVRSRGEDRKTVRADLTSKKLHIKVPEGGFRKVLDNDTQDTSAVSFKGVLDSSYEEVQQHQTGSFAHSRWVQHTKTGKMPEINFRQEDRRENENSQTSHRVHTEESEGGVETNSSKFTKEVPVSMNTPKGSLHTGTEKVAVNKGGLDKDAEPGHYEVKTELKVIEENAHRESSLIVPDSQRKEHSKATFDRNLFISQGTPTVRAQENKDGGLGSYQFWNGGTPEKFSALQKGTEEEFAEEVRRREVIEPQIKGETKHLNIRIEGANLRFRLQNTVFTVDIKMQESLERSLSYLDIQKLSKSIQALGLNMEALRVNGVELLSRNVKIGRKEDRERVNIREDAGSGKEANSSLSDSSNFSLLL